MAGEAGLEIDRLVRRVGFHRAADRDWLDASAEEQAVLEAFSAGINAYMKKGRLPLEFTLLRSKPEEWQPVDTLAFGRFFGWSLSGNWHQEIVRSWTVERFGAEVMAELEPKYAGGDAVDRPARDRGEGNRTRT